MTLEELFASKNAPRNYVEQRDLPPDNYVERSAKGDAPNKLEQFLKEQPMAKPQGQGLQPNYDYGREDKPKVKSVAAPITKELQTVSENSKKLDSETLASAKLLLSPDTQQSATIEPQQTQDQQSATTQQAAMGEPQSSPYSDYEAKIRGMMPKSDWSDFLMGLIPVGMDALAGGYGDALDVSGKYYGDKVTDDRKRTQSLEDKLLDLDKSRMMASLKGKGSGSARRWQTKPTWNRVTGKSEYAKWDGETGGLYKLDGTPITDPNVEVGFAVTPDEFNRRTVVGTQARQEVQDSAPRMNPETGNISKIMNGVVTDIPSSTKTPLNPKQEKDLDVVTKYISTDAFKKPAAVFQTASNIDRLLSDVMSNNPSSVEMARSEIAKMAEGGGRLTDDDIARVGGSKSIKNNVKRFANLQRTGVSLTPKDISDLREVAKVLRDVSAMKLKESIGALEASYLQRGGKKGAVNTAISPYVPGLYSTDKEDQKPKPPVSFEEWKKLKYGK